MPLLQATGEYYREEGNRLLTKLDCIQYMKKVSFGIEEKEWLVEYEWFRFFC